MPDNNKLSSNKRELILIDYSLQSYLSEFNKLLQNGNKNFLVWGLTPLANSFLEKVEEYKVQHDFKLYLYDKATSNTPALKTILFKKESDIDAVIVFITTSLEDILCEIENKSDIICIAPNIKTHKKVILFSVPKAGTHLLINAMHVMGYEGLGDFSNPLPKRYYYLANNKHLTYNHYKILTERDLNLLFTNPILFIYRNPRDLLLSHFNFILNPPDELKNNNILKYISKANTPEESFTLFLKSIIETGIIIEGLVSHARWLQFKRFNLLPVRFEDIIGPKGGGDLDSQINIIWKIQLRLLIPGKTSKFARKTYNKDSPTFFKGKIDEHKSFFTKHHYDLFNKINKKHGDILEKFGYK